MPFDDSDIDRLFDRLRDPSLGPIGPEEGDEAATLAALIGAARELDPPPLDPEAMDRMIRAALDEAAVPERSATSSGRSLLRWAPLLLAALALFAVWTRPTPPVPVALPTVAVLLPTSAEVGFDTEDWSEGVTVEEPARLAWGTSVVMQTASPASMRMLAGASDDKVMEVLDGEVLFEVHGRAPDERVHVRTPRGTVEVTGTVFSVRVEGERVAVAVREGSTTFRHLDGTAAPIRAGEELTIEPPDPETEARVEPPPPSRAPAAPVRRPAPPAEVAVVTPPPPPPEPAAKEIPPPLGDLFERRQPSGTASEAGARTLLTTAEDAENLADAALRRGDGVECRRQASLALERLVRLVGSFPEANATAEGKARLDTWLGGGHGPPTEAELAGAVARRCP